MTTELGAPLLGSIRQLPEYMQDGVENYILHGYPLGGFLTAIFSNDLYEAARRADDNNFVSLHLYATVIYNAPAGCHGSEEKIAAWQGVNGLCGMKDQTNAARRVAKILDVDRIEWCEENECFQTCHDDPDKDALFVACDLAGLKDVISDEDERMEEVR